ncbi:MAG: InlB B-repeat-containing protein, partial [Actinomycetes bacterium]
GSFVTGGTVSAPSATTRAGYTFAGWAATDGGDAVSFPYASPSTTNITMYALWSADSHVVTYNSKGGSTVVAGSFVTAGSLAIPYDPTRAGYSFLGWSATDGGSAVTFPYTPGVLTNITLFAKWSADSHVVTFDSKSGNAVVSGSFVTAGSVAVPPSAPTRAGYIFNGWSATDGGSAVTFPYTPGVITDVTLYALWTAVTAPSAPLNVSATAGNATATVTWSAPASTGGANIISYLVTASTGQTCETVARTCTFTGLPNKTAVTFTVVAINSVGAGATTAPTASVTPIDPNDDVLPPEGDGGTGPKEIPTNGKFVASNDPTFLFSWNKTTGKLVSKATGIYTGYIEAKITFVKDAVTYSCTTQFGVLKAVPGKTPAQQAKAMTLKTFTGKQFCVDKTKLNPKTTAPKGGFTKTNFPKIKPMNKTAAELNQEKAALAALKGYSGEVAVEVIRYRAWPTTMTNRTGYKGTGKKIPVQIRNTNVVLK